MANSLTKKDLQSIADVIRQLLDAKFEHIENKLDKCLSLLNRFSKRQRILEEKMRLIEDYFDPHPRN